MLWHKFLPSSSTSVLTQSLEFRSSCWAPRAHWRSFSQRVGNQSREGTVGAKIRPWIEAGLIRCLILLQHLRVVNWGKRQDDFLGGGGDGVPVTVVVDVVLLLLLDQPGCRILCHVAEVGFLQRAQSMQMKCRGLHPRHTEAARLQNQNTSHLVHKKPTFMDRIKKR